MNRPYRLTPMHEWHERHGAQMTEVSGWRRVIDYGDLKAEVAATNSSVGLCDATPLSKIDVQGRESERLLERFARLPAVGECISAVLPQAGGTQAYIARLTLDRFIALAEAEEELQLCSGMADAAGDGCVHVTDMTSAYAALYLAGPMSTKLLKKLGPARIDSMATGRCQESPVARVVSLLVRRDVRNVPAWLLLVSRDYGEYLWECMLSAGHEFGIRPFGMAAQRLLTGAEATDVAVV
jgi:heterotetrameric sarcosine oxidase gamma subunit